MDVTQEISRILEDRIPYAYAIETPGDGTDAEEADDSLGVVRECLVKCEPLFINDRVCMAVIPATKRIHLDRLRKYLGAENVRPATEAECRVLASASDPGAIPVFGALNGVNVLLAHELMDYQEITFVVGASQVIVHVRLPDFLITERPYVCARHAILADAPDAGRHRVVVYRLDEETMKKEPIGMLAERRRVDRGNNYLGLLRLARKEFAEAAPGGSTIVIGHCI